MKFITLPLAIVLISLSSIQAQLQNTDQQQLRLHIKQDGKIQFMDFALSKTYFAKATASSFQTEEGISSEFTEKGTDLNSYHAYTYFLSKDEVIVAQSETAEFKGVVSGIYSLSGYTYPAHIAANIFVGQSFKRLDNHPMFHKDPEVYKLMVTLIVPRKEKPMALETTSESDVVLGQSVAVEASIPDTPK